MGSAPCRSITACSALPSRTRSRRSALRYGIFEDHTAQTDALQFSGSYKVVFLAFPFEAYGSATQKADLVNRVMTYFGP